MFNYVVFPQIQQNKDCNILNTFDNTVACASQAKKSMNQPNRKSILHMTKKIIACLWRSSLQLWTRSMETQRLKTPSSTGSCDIFLSFSLTPSTGSALRPYKTIQFTHFYTKSHLIQVTPLEAELLHQSHSAPSYQWPSSPISSFLLFVQVYTILHFW